MKKRARIIEISGFRGILKALFFVTCLAAGFVAFPGFVAMMLWNRFASPALPEINLIQGILLWAIAFLVYFIMTKSHVEICFGTPKELSEEEMSVLMERIKNQSGARMNNIIIKNLEELKKEEVSKEEKSDSITK